MRITSDSLHLRRFRPDDLEALVKLADNPNVARFLAKRFPHPYGKKDADDWINLTQSETRPCNFAIESGGAFVGGIGLIPMEDIHSGTSEIGYWLGEPYWGKGIASEAVALILPYAFGELMFTRLQAMVFAENHASMRVLEKCGFTREGVLRRHIRKNGSISDAAIYAKLRNE